MTLLINHVSKTYSNGVAALKDVSLTIPVGLYGLLGPNGAGKSTLMRIIATLQDPDKGTVQLGELDVLKQKQEVREQLGYLPQEFGVYERVRAEDMLSHMAILRGYSNASSRSEVVKSLLRKVNLWDVRRQKLGGFSGGMKQRFGVAIALLGDPRLLIVDEPTAGLDPSERLRFLNLLGELGERSIVLFSTHIVEDVSDLCSRMAVIHQGQILLEAEPFESVNGLKGKIWRRFLANEKEFEILEREHVIVARRRYGSRTIVHVYNETCPGSQFEPAEPDLKDVYFSAMAGLIGNRKAENKTGS